MRCYAVIDTNVIVLAFLTKNKDASTIRVIDKIISGDVRPLISKEILAEYSEVLNRSKFSFNSDSIIGMLCTFERVGEMVEPSPSGEKLPDMKDLPFYEVVLEKKDDGAYLVTGNAKHFPKKPFIVTVTEFLEILSKNQ